MQNNFWRLFRKGIRKKFGNTIIFFKHLFKIFLVLTVIIGFSAIFHFNTDTTLTKDALVIYEYAEGDYVNKGINEDVAEKIKNFIENQDERITEKFKEQEWKVLLSPELPLALRGTLSEDIIANETNEEYYSLNGLTIPKARIIYINSKNTEEDMYDIFLHEFGHFIDYQLGYPSTYKEFEELYEIIKKSPMFNEYETANVFEFFATSCMYYFNYNDMLKERLPSMYEYIDSVIKSMSFNHIPAGNKVSLDSFWSPAFAGCSAVYAQLKLNLRETFSQLWGTSSRLKQK